MNEKYLFKLQADLWLKNFTKNTCEDYCRFVKMRKKTSTVNVYTAAIRFFFEYTLGYVWYPKKILKMKRSHVFFRAAGERSVQSPV